MTGGLLLLAVVAWVALPFLPAVREALLGRDAGALPISDRYREDRRLGVAPDGRVTVLPENETPPAPLDTPIAVTQAARGEDGAAYDDLCADGPVRLGAGCTVRSRLHGRSTVEVGAGSVLLGTAEAGDLLWLGMGCQFERLHAPTIRVGTGATCGPVPRVVPVDMAPPPEADVRAGRALVRGDFSVPSGARLDLDLVVTGTLRIGTGAQVFGSVKARRDLVLEPGALVGGSAVSDADVVLGPHASVGGAAIAGGHLQIGLCACVGRPLAPASATGRTVAVADGGCVHGTLWAQQAGHTAPATCPEAAAA